MLLQLVNLAEQKISDESKVFTRVDFAEKSEIDRSTLYSFDGPFQLVHADVRNLEFLGKLAVDLYSSKVYVYLMRLRKQILQKLNQFYDEIKIKRKKKTTRLQVDNEFRQVKVKDLYEKYGVEMFTTTVKGGKAFAAEQIIRELKSRIEKLSAFKMKVHLTTIILQSAENMNNLKSKKYGASPNEIQQKLLSSKNFRALFNFHRRESSKKIHDRLDRYDRKKYAAKKQKLREELDIGEKMLILAKRIKKNQHLVNFINKHFKIFIIFRKKKYLQ